MKAAAVTVNVTHLDKVRDLLEFCWHNRDCSAVDADGEWRPGNADCDCGYDEAKGAFDRAAEDQA